MIPPPDHCLICYQEQQYLSSFEGRPDEFSTLSKELNVVFILRKIFEVPRDYFVDYMVETGNNPSQCIKLCANCKLFVEKGKGIYREILEASKKLRKVKGDIIQYLRRNNRKIMGGDGGGSSGGVQKSAGMKMTNEIRKFVSEHDYSASLVDPFIGGDCEAQKLLYSSNVVPEVDDNLLQIIKLEHISQEDLGSPCDDEDDVNGYDAATSFSPPPTDDPNDPLWDQQSEKSCPPKRRRHGNSSGSSSVAKVESDLKALKEAHHPIGCSTTSDGEKQWSCSCGRSYADDHKLRRHIKEAIMEPSSMLVCHLCGKLFRRGWDVKRHLTNSHGQADATTPSGRKRPSNNFSAAVPEENTFIPKTEGVTVTSSESVIRHEFQEDSHKMEDGTEYWKCTCGKIYLAKLTLLRHVREATMDPDSRIKCSICGGKFRRRFDLNRHMSGVHGIDSRIGTVEKEGKRELEDGGEDSNVPENVEDDDSKSNFGTSKEKMTRKSEPSSENVKHVKLGFVFDEDDGTERWKCSCGRSYCSNEALHRHVKEKNMDPSKWIQCEHCDKSFKRPSELKRHTDSVHLKQTYPCENCGQVYSQRSKLNVHQRDKCCGLNNESRVNQDDTLVEKYDDQEDEEEEMML